MPSKRILTEICDDCPREYCTLKEILLRGGMSDRMLVQLKVMEMFKYDESQRQKQDIGWEGATQLFHERKLDEKFAEVYKPELHPRTIYKRLNS